MYVYMYIYIYTYVYMCMCVHIYIYIYTYIYTYMYMTSKQACSRTSVILFRQHLTRDIINRQAKRTCIAAFAEYNILESDIVY